MGTFLGGPYSKEDSILGSILNSPVLGNYHFGVECRMQPDSGLYFCCSPLAFAPLCSASQAHCRPVPAIQLYWGCIGNILRSYWDTVSGFFKNQQVRFERILGEPG